MKGRLLVTMFALSVGVPSGGWAQGVRANESPRHFYEVLLTPTPEELRDDGYESDRPSQLPDRSPYTP